jgi:N utilization substance protein A
MTKMTKDLESWPPKQSWKRSTSPDHQIALAEVLEVAPEAQVGDTVVLDVTPEQKDFGRMAAIQTKQVLAQKLRDQQRKLIQEEFQDSGRALSCRRRCSALSASR